VDGVRGGDALLPPLLLTIGVDGAVIVMVAVGLFIIDDDDGDGDAVADDDDDVGDIRINDDGNGEDGITGFIIDVDDDAEGCAL
jgi:hypothetical protein